MKSRDCKTMPNDRVNPRAPQCLKMRDAACVPVLRGVQQSLAAADCKESPLPFVDYVAGSVLTDLFAKLAKFSTVHESRIQILDNGKNCRNINRLTKL